MKSTIKKIKQQQTIQPTKITKNRITALLLALLLVTMVLSPTIPVKAQETTADGADMTENNAEGGGHQTGTGGDGETSGGRPTGNDGSFESDLRYKVTKGLSEKVYSRSHSVYIKGEGHFNVRSVDILNLANEAHIYYVYVFSDKPFTTEGPLYDAVDGETTVYETYNKSDKGTTKRLFGDNLYYYSVYDIGVVGKNDELISFTSPNKLTFTSSTGSYDSEDIQKYVENTLDLSKDDYMSEDDIANMKPVRDPSIGYLPRARYSDDREDVSSLRNAVSSIQWDSSQESYATDLENPYYVEIYANLHCVVGNASATPIIANFQYKKYGELKYVDGSLEFSYPSSFYAYFSAFDLGYHDSDLIFPQSFVDSYFVRLLHYDYDKQQLLCGDWTELVVDGLGSGSGGGHRPGDSDEGGHLTGIKISPLTDRDIHVTYGKDNIIHVKIDTDNSYIVVSNYSSTITWAGVPIDNVIYSGSTAILYLTDYASPKTYTLTAIYDDGVRRFSSSMDFEILKNSSEPSSESSSEPSSEPSSESGSEPSSESGSEPSSESCSEPSSESGSEPSSESCSEPSSKPSSGDNPGNGDKPSSGKPDFDIDFSNLFTLIYSIIKALIDFIISVLNMLIEFATLLFEQIGEFSPLIGGVFSFLPEEFITMLLSGITIIVIVGIIKR